MEMIERIERLDTFIKEGRLIRKRWVGKSEDGRELACLLVALSPEVGVKGTSNYCPSEVMPLWFAKLTPWINDEGSDERWLGVVERYSSLAKRWSVLSPNDWHKLNFRVRAICVREAQTHTKDERILKVCVDVVTLCDRAVEGNEPTTEEWSRARAAANAAAYAAAYAAASAADAAAYAAASAADAAADAAAAAAARAADAAADAAAAAAARAADAAAATVARTASVDRQIEAILSALDNACTLAEGRSATLQKKAQRYPHIHGGKDSRIIAAYMKVLQDNLKEFPSSRKVRLVPAKKWGVWGSNLNGIADCWCNLSPLDESEFVAGTKGQCEAAAEALRKTFGCTGCTYTVMRRDELVWGLLRVPLTKQAVLNMIKHVEAPWADGRGGNQTPVKFNTKQAAEAVAKKWTEEKPMYTYVPHVLPKELW